MTGDSTQGFNASLVSGRLFLVLEINMSLSSAYDKSFLHFCPILSPTLPFYTTYIRICTTLTREYKIIALPESMYNHIFVAALFPGAGLTSSS